MARRACTFAWLYYVCETTAISPSQEIPNPHVNLSSKTLFEHRKWPETWRRPHSAERTTTRRGHIYSTLDVGRLLYPDTWSIAEVLEVCSNTVGVR